MGGFRRLGTPHRRGGERGGGGGGARGGRPPRFAAGSLTLGAEVPPKYGAILNF